MGIGGPSGDLLMSAILIMTIATYILQSWFATWRGAKKNSVDNVSNDEKNAA